MKKKIAFFTFLFTGILVISFFSSNVSACSCTELPTAAEELEHSQVCLTTEERIQFEKEWLTLSDTNEVVRIWDS